jgi:transglutaminase-like putative cysteine protease
LESCEKIQEEKEEEDEIAEMFNNRYEKNFLKYPARKVLGERVVYRDPRTYFSPDSHILSRVRLAGEKEEEIVFNAFNWVRKNITYVSDDLEWWQEPEVTYQTKKGDCEDGAMLTLQLCLLHGVPSYRIKVYYGWVKKKNGERVYHAWFGYRRRKDDEIVVLDWCFYPTKSCVNRRKPMKDQELYLFGKEIAASFNDEFTWSNEEVVLPGRVNSG